MVRLLVLSVLLSVIACTAPGCVPCDDPIRETMVTRPATDVTSTSATLNGSTPNYHDGILGSDRTSACFEWYSEADETRLFTPDQYTWRFQDISENITGLTPGTTYYFRARWVERFNTETHPPGEWMSFTCPTETGATVYTLDATGISSLFRHLERQPPGLAGCIKCRGLLPVGHGVRLLSQRNPKASDGVTWGIPGRDLRPVSRHHVLLCRQGVVLEHRSHSTRRRGELLCGLCRCNGSDT